MTAEPPRRPARRGRACVSTLALLLPTATGCAHWTATHGTPVTVIESAQPERVRVTDEAGTRLVLDQPRIEGHELVGVRGGSSAPGTPLQEERVPLATVSRMEVREGDLSRTLGFVAGGIAWVGGAVALLGLGL